MIPYLRKKRILDELEKKEIVYLEHFVDILYEVSESTIRRDLKILSDEGKIILLHGGAIKLKKNSKEVPVVSKKLMNVLVGVITTKLFPLREIGTNVFPLFTFSEVFRY